MSPVSVLRLLQWNAGGLSQAKRMELLQTLHERDIDVFTIMEANLTADSRKYYPFQGYSLFVLTKFRQIASGILVGVKRNLTAD
jgi:exonuclease III